ncbi:MAG: YwiC-like family protein [Fimbriimonadaceae bacterium]|nr:YwiC-like family protein [Fimbriimonadaceae bacterium]
MRPLLPREHGAWGMLLLPALAGLLLGGGGAAGWLGLLLVLAAYLLRAPLEAIARGRHDAVVWTWLTIYLAVAVLSTAGLAALGRVAWWPVPLVLGPVLALTLWFASRRAGREVLNELVGAIALPAAGLVTYAAAAGRLEAAAIHLGAACALYNAVTVPYIRTWVMARRAFKNEAWLPVLRRVRWAAAAALVGAVVLVVGLWAGGVWPRLLAMAFVPGWWRIASGLPRAGQVDLPIQTLGWLEMAHASLFTVVVAVALV